MTASPRNGRPHRFAGVLDDPQVQVALVTAVALLAQAVLAKNVLDVKLDIFSQYAALWVFIVYALSGERSRMSAILTSLVVVAVTAAVLIFASL